MLSKKVTRLFEFFTKSFYIVAINPKTYNYAKHMHN